MMTIPKGSSSGRVLRLKGRGFTAKGGARGDELVTIEIEIPASDAKLEEFAGKWDGGGDPRSNLGV
jgi:DnaJ-class molecular chaperone